MLLVQNNSEKTVLGTNTEWTGTFIHRKQTTWKCQCSWHSPSSGSGCWHRISRSGRWCRPRDGSEQRKWLLAPHQRKWPLMQVKKYPQQKWLLAPHQCNLLLMLSCRKVKTQRQMAGQMTSSVWHLRRSDSGAQQKWADWGGEICTGWCDESCVRGCGGCERWRGRAACVDVAGISLTEGGRTKMRDKSIQCE